MHNITNKANLTNVRQRAARRDNNTNTEHTMNDYAIGYMDAINGEINLTAYDTSNSYHAGYEDALHDMEFTIEFEDTF